MFGRTATFLKALALVAGGAVVAFVPSVPEADGGVVVEAVDPDSVLSSSGLRPGDVLLRWERLPHPPANPEGARGEFLTPFDWMGLEVEQAHRGPVRLVGRRGGAELTLTVPLGEWNVHFNSEKRARSWVRPDLESAALVGYRRGEELAKRGRLAEAVERWKGLVAKLDPVAERALRCWLHFRSGEVWGEEGGRWQEAAEAFATALEQAAEPPERIFVLEALAKSHEYRSDNLVAELSYREALAIREAVLGEASLHVARGHHQIASMAWGRGEFTAAQEHFDRALALRQRYAAGSYLESDSLHSQALLARERADLESAEDFIRRALTVQARFAPASIWAAYMLDTLGSVLALRGDATQAEDELARALAIREALIPVSIPTATTLGNLGDLALRRGDLTTAERRHREALEMRRRVFPDSLAEAHSLRSLAEIAVARGALDEAERLYREAQQIAERRAPESLHVAAGLTGLGRVAAQRGDSVAALALYRRAFVIQERLAPGSEAQALTLHTIGTTLARSGRAEAAAENFESALSSLELQVERLGGTDVVRGGFRAHRAYLYHDLLALQLDLGRAGDAFETLERYRAQSFLAALAGRGMTLDLPPAAAARHRDLRLRHDRIFHHLGELSSIDDREEVERLREELTRVRRELDALRVGVREGSPTPRAGSAPLGATAVAEGLDPGTALVSYSVGAQNIRVFVLAPGGPLQVETLAVSEAALAREIEEFVQLCREVPAGHPRMDAIREVGRRLYRRLLAPVESHLAHAERLLIVPDGPLHALPWDALVRSRHDEGDEGYLVEWRPVHVALSATVFAELKKRRTVGPAAAATLAAFGDPIYPRRFLRVKPEAIADPRLSSAARRGFAFEPLPFSRVEVEHIGGLYPRSQVYLGAEATEEAAMEAASWATVIHLATHAVMDEQIPFNSALALSMPEDVTPGRENGFLQAWEIIERWRLHADLVVLSACDTGIGKDLGGEGLIGLTRALQLAGARSVVATLWRVEDRATAELMIRFHRHLRRGLAKDDALRAAKLELIRGTGTMLEPAAPSGGSYSAPLHWAAFQLYGDWR